MPEFIHLHNHTHYSLLDGACTVDGLIDAALANNMSSVALTDHGVNFGLMEFYKKAKRRGVRPILGCEVYVSDESRFTHQATNRATGKRNYYHLILLAKNIEGYRNLNRLTSRAHIEGFYYKPRVDRQLVSELKDGLIALSACAGGVVSAHLVSGDYDRAREAAIWYRETFGKDFYLELQDHGIPVDPPVLEGIPRLSAELGIPMVVTNDCHYIEREHAVAHNVLLHIRDSSKNGALVDVESELRYGAPNFYFKSADEMASLFRKYPEAIENTLAVAEQCNVEIPNGFYMPRFPIPPESNAKTLEDYIVELTWKGMEKRYDQIGPELRERTDFELSVINSMGFAGYFLIVQDFIAAARMMGVSVGPGRGSAAGSVVAFALGITNIDPIKYDLLFERFLNPDRISMPDIDIDFADDKREKVIDYVKQKYGEEAVSQIITFGTLSSRAVLKDVGRVLGIPLSTINSITDKIEVKFGKVAPLRDAIETAELRWVKESNDPQIRKLIAYSTVLEGFNRNASLHAAGVVIAPGPLEDYIPLYKTPDSGLASQYQMKYLEEAGLLKMDFLGLRTLTIIDTTVELVRQRHGISIDIDAIPLDDEKTYQLFGNGLTTAIFQFESPPMQKYLRDLKPSVIEDLIAMNALYRPGPMDNIPDFIDRKRGRKPIEFLHPMLEPILSRTYGVCAYQEQVMQIAQQIGGFTLAQADSLRRAMGKKNISEMESMMPAYFEGCATRGIDKKTAEAIWDMMLKFANYGFNKSHSAAYAYIAYQTAWLKANFTAEFMAANMTAESGTLEKVVKLIDDCRRFDIRVLPPDVNESQQDFTVTDAGIRFGLAAIRNVGANAVAAIIQERSAAGSFTTLFNFTRRMSATPLVNKRLVESLVVSGAFDSSGYNRRSNFEAIDAAVNYASACASTHATGMTSLFASEDDDPGAAIPEPPMTVLPEWPRMERLRREKEVLNFYVSGHPLQDYELEVDAFSQIRLGEPPEDASIQNAVRVCGIISSVRTKLDRRENTIAFVGIEDFTGKGEVVFWSDAYRKFSAMLTVGEVVFVIGKAESNGSEGLKIIADDVVPIRDASARFANAIVISVELNTLNEIAAEATRDLFRQHKGNLQCIFRIYDENRELTRKFVARNYTISPDRDLIDGLRHLYGRANVALIGS